MLKSELRKIYLAKRQNLSPAEREEKSRAIANLFFQTFDLTRIKFLHCFFPLERTNEIDAKLIFEGVWRDFPQVVTAVPRVNLETDAIESLRFTPETKLVKSSWGIYEPGGNEFLESEKNDAVVVPLLCFDRRGFRVGYGKGFYDKFLKNCRADCRKIGLSYFAPVEEIEDVREFDVKLDFCITPERVVNCE